MTDQEKYVIDTLTKYAPSVRFEMTNKMVKGGWIGVVAHYEGLQAEIPITPDQINDEKLREIANIFEEQTK